MSKKTVTVVGIGRVGLPLALFLADKGYRVFGIGRNQEKSESLKKGKMPFMEKGAGRLLKKYVGKTFFPTTSFKGIKESKVLILTLGTPVDSNMDPSYDQINEALEKMIPYFKRNQLLILRSTVSPKSTEYVKDFIETKTRLRVSRDLFLAFCPERIAEGNALEEIKEIPQIVGGIDKKSASQAQLFFESLGVRCLVSDAVSAELAKLFTNMYRYISFAIANEFMVIAENFHRNIYEIVELVNKDYKRGGLALPGFTGGPCLFKDGFFLIGDNPFLDLISSSWKINEAIPLFLVKKIRERTKLKNKKVAILGLAFKPEIDDIRESLSFKLRKALLREHAQIVLHDPYVKDYKHQEVLKDLKNALPGVDVLIIATRHKVYFSKKNEILRLLDKNVYICDIWNVFGTNNLIFRKNSLK